MDTKRHSRARLVAWRSGVACAALFAVAALACDGGGRPTGHRPAPTGTGPLIRWDLAADPLPDIPLPNDVATWPDPTSPTGRRINASFLADTRLESSVRRVFGSLDGWGAYMPVTVSFDAPIDLEGFIAAQGPDRFSEASFPGHAIYLVDMETGVPVPLDVGHGAYHYLLDRTGRYYPNDPRAAEANLLFESVEEDLDGDGELDPGEDTDFDGVLDHPNTRDGRAGATPEETYDRTVFFYERETNTLFLRPIIPLRERRTYAVVVTPRLRGVDGQPVRSPFDGVHHVSQTRALASLPDVLARHPQLYGSLARRGWEGIAFAWSFTTQSLTSGLDEARSGLYGRGRLAFLAEQFSPDMRVAPLRGGSPSAPCAEPGTHLAIATTEQMLPLIDRLAETAFGVDRAGRDLLLATFDQVSHFVVGVYETPYLLGDPRAPTPDARWDLDAVAQTREVARDLVPVVIAVPRELEGRAQPFPVAIYGHGHTSSNLEGLGFAGLLARRGIATVAIDAEGHGLALDPSFRGVVEALFAVECLGPMGQVLAGVDRSVDLDGDGAADSGGNFWSAYVFHTRDAVRQTVLDHVQLVRVLRHFGVEAPRGPRPALGGAIPIADREPIDALTDFDGNGVIDIAGDFDGNGVPDVGGWSNGYSAWGQSLGGFISAILAGVEPAIRTAAPTSGAAGLLDVGVRSQISAVQHAAILRMLGPLVVSEPAGEGELCAAGQHRVSFVVTNVSRAARVEIACLATGDLREGDAIIVRNLRSRESRCGGVGSGGAFRVPIPSDTGDRISVELYRDAALTMDYGTCRAREGETLDPPIRTIDEWEVGALAGDGESCTGCPSFQGESFLPGDRLRAPTEGFGLRRQTPEFRRFFALAQMAVDPGDPIHYVRRVFLDPVTAPDWRDPMPRSIIVASSIGDQDVPLSASAAMARAAGVLAFLPPEAPDLLADYRTPASFRAERSEGVSTPQELLDFYHVLEGVTRVERHPVMANPRFLADVDDLGDGRQLYTAEGGFGGDVAPVRAAPPLRWTRASAAWSPGASVFDPPVGSYDGLSAVLHVYVDPRGNHGTEIPNPDKTFDEGVYFVQLLARWFETQGRDLRYHTDPAGHGCLEDTTCAF